MKVNISETTKQPLKEIFIQITTTKAEEKKIQITRMEKKKK